MRALSAAVSLVALSCAAREPPREDLSQEDVAAHFRSRTCSAVLAAFANGVRPSMLEIEVPGTAGAPAARVLLMAPHIVSAEACLGERDPFVASPTRHEPSPDASATASTIEPKAPRPTDEKPRPLDTRN